MGRIADLALDAALPPGVGLRPVVGERDIAALLAVSDEVFGGHHGPAGALWRLPSALATTTPFTFTASAHEGGKGRDDP